MLSGPLDLNENETFDQDLQTKLEDKSLLL
jgi:hypothetical protein